MYHIITTNSTGEQSQKQGVADRARIEKMEGKGGGEWRVVQYSTVHPPFSVRCLVSNETAKQLAAFVFLTRWLKHSLNDVGAQANRTCHNLNTNKS